MTDVLTRPTVPTLEQLNSAILLGLQPAWNAWQDTLPASPEARVRNWDTLIAEPLPGDRYSGHCGRFLTWLAEHPEHLPVPQGNRPAFEPIGPHTPGWSAWWEKLAEHAVEGGYEQQYNLLAAHFGVDPIEEEEEEVDHYVDVDVTLSVRVYVTALPSRVEADGVEEFVDEEMVDDAIRDYLRNQSVEWSISEYGQN